MRFLRINEENMKDVYFVFEALTGFIYELQKYCATLEVIQKTKAKQTHEKTIPAVVEISERAIEQQILSVLSKIFDKEAFGNMANCSFKKLQAQCKDFEVSEVILGEIDELYNKYEETLSVHVRNKKIAHFDLETLQSGEITEIEFEQLKSLLTASCKALSTLSEEIFWSDVSFPSIERLVSDMENQLKSYMH